MQRPLLRVQVRADLHLFLFGIKNSEQRLASGHPALELCVHIGQDLRGRINAIIDVKTTLIVPAVRVAITLGKLAA